MDVLFANDRRDTFFSLAASPPRSAFAKEAREPMLSMATAS